MHSRMKKNSLERTPHNRLLSEGVTVHEIVDINDKIVIALTSDTDEEEMADPADNHSPASVFSVPSTCTTTLISYIRMDSIW